MLRISGRVFFANAERIGQKLRPLVEEARPSVVVLDLRAVPDLEYTALKMLMDAEQRQREHGRSVWLVGMNPEVKTVIENSPLGERLGPERMHYNLESAVAHYLAESSPRIVDTYTPRRWYAERGRGASSRRCDMSDARQDGGKLGFLDALGRIFRAKPEAAPPAPPQATERLREDRGGLRRRDPPAERADRGAAAHRGPDALRRRRDLTRRGDRCRSRAAPRHRPPRDPRRHREDAQPARNRPLRRRSRCDQRVPEGDRGHVGRGPRLPRAAAARAPCDRAEALRGGRAGSRWRSSSRCSNARASTGPIPRITDRRRPRKRWSARAGGGSPTRASRFSRSISRSSPTGCSGSCAAGAETIPIGARRSGRSRCSRGVGAAIRGRLIQEYVELLQGDRDALLSRIEGAIGKEFAALQSALAGGVRSVEQANLAVASALGVLDEVVPGSRGRPCARRCPRAERTGGRRETPRRGMREWGHGWASAPARVRPKLKRKDYERELRRLQAELCALQDWIRETGERVIVVFEGRDAAGKGGTIKAITERVSPRVFRVVALPAPSDREKTQLYMQRYLAHFPAGGEIVIFDRSWYNRAGVETVLGFCTPEQRDRFLERCPEFESYVVEQRHPADQVLARGRRGRAEAPLPGAHRRPGAAVEAVPDRPRIAPPLVRLLARARRDARGHRHRGRAVAHRPDRRQAPRPARTASPIC